MSNIESYPPILRRSLNGDGAEPEKDDGSPTEEEPTGSVIRDKEILIPVMDLENPNIEKLKEACKNWGIFRLENHGIPLALTTELREVSKELLCLPFETKRNLLSLSSSPPLSYFWGTPALTPAGTALQKGTNSNNIDLVEGFNVPLSHLSTLRLHHGHDQDHHHHPKLESFRALMEEYGKHLSRIAVAVFEAIAETLNLEPRHRRPEYLSPATGFVRVYRYPWGSGSGSRAWGMNVHTDSSVISILSQDEVGGLEFMKDGEWFHVQPVPNSLIVNLGDMIQAISDDEYKSVKHRVGVKQNKKERYSICYFVFPDKDCIIKSSNYKAFTYSEFQAQVQLDIHTFGSKVGLPRFKLPL